MATIIEPLYVNVSEQYVKLYVKQCTPLATKLLQILNYLPYHT